MNLLQMAIPAISTTGKSMSFIPSEVSIKGNLSDFDYPRPDFQGAAYQLMIGLLQTCFAPEDVDEWAEYWNHPPDAIILRNAFAKYEKAFEFGNEKKASFLQDFDLLNVKPSIISEMFIESPGRETIQKNRDHFIKRDTINAICHQCAAMALFTLQCNAPSGGSGHRTSLRGGGPLTTLVFPQNEISTLWQKLWLNVIPNDQFECDPITNPREVFPWLARTRTSEKKGEFTLPDNVHQLQMFWGMPRRIRIDFENTKKGKCDICDCDCESLIQYYKTIKHGINYGDGWRHTLSPYKRDPKKLTPPLPVKGQKGGLGYRHWVGMTIGRFEAGEEVAEVVNSFNRKMLDVRELENSRLLCFGYDMDNMKARCWYEHTFPVFKLTQEEKENILIWGGDFVATAADGINTLRQYLKAAWFERPKDAKGDISFIDTEIWDRTETEFYQMLPKLVEQKGLRGEPKDLYEEWILYVRRKCRELFDERVFSYNAEDQKLERIQKAKRECNKWLSYSPWMKKMNEKAKILIKEKYGK